MEERFALQEAGALLADFLDKGDLKRLAQDAGMLMNCPLLVLDDTFHVLAHYKTDHLRSRRDYQQKRAPFRWSAGLY